MSDTQALLRKNDADANALLSVRGLTKVYQTGAVKVHALRGIDLTIKRGELIVMLGASGSGKSTLLNIIGGLDTPTTGTVKFMGEDITGLRPSGQTQFRRAHVGFIFQFYNLVPSLTARENVALVTEISKNPIAPEEALRMVGLGQRIHHFPAQLSGGEQQRVAVARAIAKRPNLLLCDEPTGALDSRTGVQVLEALKTVNEELGATTLIITHNVGIAEMSDRVIRLSDGMISEEQAMHRRRNPSELSW